MLVDEGRRLVLGELPAGLALGEAQSTSGVAKPVVAGLLQERLEVLDLLVRRRRTGLLPEAHTPLSAMAVARVTSVAGE